MRGCFEWLAWRRLSGVIAVRTIGKYFINQWVLRSVQTAALVLISTQAALAQMSTTAPEQTMLMHQSPMYGRLTVDQFEYQATDPDETLAWDVKGWYGGDFDRVWIKAEGESSLQGNKDDAAEIQLLFSRLVAPFWELQAGVRHDRVADQADNDTRSFAVVGIQGLAPYRFETESALFVSEKGDLSLRLDFESDLLITQRLILQPQLKTDAALNEVAEFGIGKGINDVNFGLRLRYEIRREIAPYIGVNWHRFVGGTADFVRQSGDKTSDAYLVGGLRVWF